MFSHDFCLVVTEPAAGLFKVPPQGIHVDPYRVFVDRFLSRRMDFSETYVRPQSLLAFQDQRQFVKRENKQSIEEMTGLDVKQLDYEDFLEIPQLCPPFNGVNVLYSAVLSRGALNDPDFLECFNRYLNPLESHHQNTFRAIGLNQSNHFVPLPSLDASLNTLNEVGEFKLFWYQQLTIKSVSDNDGLGRQQSRRDLNYLRIRSSKGIKVLQEMVEQQPLRDIHNQKGLVLISAPKSSNSAHLDRQVYARILGIEDEAQDRIKLFYDRNLAQIYCLYQLSFAQDPWVWIHLQANGFVHLWCVQ